MTSELTRNPTIDLDKLDTKYSIRGIYMLEKIFGYGWLSPGGEVTAKEFFLNLELRPGQKVLDIGSGIGGAAFYVARQYGVHVQGVDLSKFATQIARQRLAKHYNISEKLSFVQDDIRKIEFQKASFDAIYCRDVMVHIREKGLVLKKIKEWLKPGGKLLITDYCRGESEPTQEFITYTKNFSYDMITVMEYSKLVDTIGFGQTEYEDISDKFLQVHIDELKHFIAAEEYTIQEFGKEAYDEIVARWSQKIRQTTANVQAWVYFLITK